MKLDKNDVNRALINENVDVVVNFLNKYLKEEDKNNSLCDCQECLMDIIAIALNNIKPRYRLICRHAHKEPDVVKQIGTEVREAVIKAINFVKMQPHH